MTRYRSLLGFLSLAVIWGSAFVAIEIGLTSLPPVLFAAVRYDIAAVVMLAYAAYATDDPIPRGRAAWLVVAVGASLLIAAYHVFLFVGQQHTTAAAAAIVVSLSPMLTTGFARALVPSDALSATGVVGLAIGLVGVAFVVRPDRGGVGSAETVGGVLVFCGAAAFAFGSVLTRRIDADLSIETMQAWSMLGGALLMHLVSLAIGERFVPADWTTPEAVGAVVYLSVVASALGFLLYFDLLARLGAVEINMVSYAVPPVTAVVGWLALGQGVGPSTAFGFGCIVVGFVLVKRRALREELVSIRRWWPAG